MLSKGSSRIAVALVGLVCSTFAGSAQAAQILDVLNANVYVRGTWANFGYSFSVQEPVRVDALGLWDLGADGLVDAHPVGLWDASGNMLAQAVVDNTSSVVASANASNAWRYADISSVLLAPGEYKLGAFYPTAADPFAVSTAEAPGSFVFGSGVTYVQSYVTTGGTEFFTEPVTVTGFNPAFFGPNAMFTAVPEPATLSLLALGGLAMLRRRR